LKKLAFGSATFERILLLPSCRVFKELDLQIAPPVTFHHYFALKKKSNRWHEAALQNRRCAANPAAALEVAAPRPQVRVAAARR
jgi:hypothetical protein